MKLLQFSLPFPPSVNRYWRAVNKGRAAGRVLISEEGRAYRDAVAVHVVRQGVPRERLDGSLELEIEAFMPDRRRRDLDNLLKATLDAIVHANVVAGDEWFDRISIRREALRPRGELWLTLRQTIAGIHQGELLERAGIHGGKRA